MLTQKELKKHVSYHPYTGLLIRIKTGYIIGQNVKKTNYIRVKINDASYTAHRLAFLYMTGKIPKTIDHFDQNKHNNKWNNIFAATFQENSRNRAINKNSKSGITGVYWHKAAFKWRAEVMVNKKHIHLGYFINKQDAIEARHAANIKYGFNPNQGKQKEIK